MCKGKGFDGNKKIKGRKRSIVVDKQGRILDVKIVPANQHDTIIGTLSIKSVLKKFPSIKRIAFDKGYRGTTTEFIKKTGRKALLCPPIRFVVERTFAWLNNFRRLSKDYEVLAESARDFIYLANISLCLKKIICY